MISQWCTIALLAIIGVVVKSTSDYDFRAFDFGDEDTEFFGGSYEKSFSDHGGSYFPTDFNLGSLDLIAATPKFARMASYVDPSEVRVARMKRKTASGSGEEAEEDDGDDEGSSEEEKSDGGGGVDDYADRYERFVSRHFRDRDEQRKKDDAEGAGDSYEYRFDFGPSDDYERIKQESEAQSRQLAKDPKNCKAHEQDGMVCHVCRDPVTDTTSESCSYATVPHHNKFAYVKQKNYNSKDHEKEPETEGQSEEDDRDADQVDEEQEGSEEVTQQPPKKRHENILVKPKHIPRVTPTKKPVVHHKPGTTSTTTTNGGGYRYDPRSNRERPRSAPMKVAANPGYFYTQHFFPSEGGAKASEKIRRQEQPEQRDEAVNEGGDSGVFVLASLRNNPDEVAKVLADFESRDWSNCKKGKKNDLTCYTCTDSAGVKHEECMYVSESRQVPFRVLPVEATPTSTPQPSTETVLKPTKKTSHRAGVAGRPNQTKKPKKKAADGSEKKPISPKLRKLGNVGKPQKLVQLEPAEQEQEQEQKSEHQTVKRTVSIMSHVDERGPKVQGGGRVMHYEHQVTHTV